MEAPSLSKRPSANFTPAQTLFISVIIPVRNEVLHLEQTLAGLFAQEYDRDRLEILVVDGESTDGTPALVARLIPEHPELRLLHNPVRLSSGARNVGIRAARGDVVVIVDGHCEIRDVHHLQRLAEAFERSGADCLGRPQPLDVSHANPLQHAIAAARASRLGHHPDSFIYSSAEQFVPAKSVAIAYRRDLFERIGFFDERFDACEDVELNHRIDQAGLKCFFTPQIAISYVPRSRLSGLFRQLVRYGRGRVRLLRKHRDTFSLPCFVPLLFGVWLLGWGVVGCFWQPGWLIAAGTLGIYTGAQLLEALRLAVHCRRLSFLWRLPLVWTATHAAAATGTFLELLSRMPKQRELQP